MSGTCCNPFPRMRIWKLFFFFFGKRKYKNFDSVLIHFFINLPTKFQVRQSGKRRLKLQKGFIDWYDTSTPYLLKHLADWLVSPFCVNDLVILNLRMQRDKIIVKIGSPKFVCKFPLSSLTCLDSAGFKSMIYLFFHDKCNESE